MVGFDESAILQKIEAYMASVDRPRFPVTKTSRLDLPYYSNIWLKDESVNLTGTHKDRMAWEIVMVYFDILKKRLIKPSKNPLPRFSIISAGSAALAIQTQLNYFGLPSLKVLADKQVDLETLEAIKVMGAEVYLTCLDDKMLSSRDILWLTDNPGGFDITSNKGFDPTLRFYDWFSLEVLNENPDYVVVPFGTGQLFENVLNIAKLILENKLVDEHYTGDRHRIAGCHFIGATSNNPLTKATKLYAPFRPFTSTNSEWIELLVARGYCGDQSQILDVGDDFIEYGYALLLQRKISVEFSGAAALGLMYQYQNKLKIPFDAKILVVSTGKAKIL